VYSQPVLLALVATGMSRDDAYRVVQRAAATATKERRSFREVLEADPEAALDAAALDRAFDLDRVLANRGRFLDALEGLA
jgi:adenylosuccinate lyase